MRFQLISAVLGILLYLVLCGIAFGAETIHGKACYRFSDNESIAVARDIALSMAKRDALEGYAVFVESSSVLENTTLKNDIISSVSAGLMRQIKVVGQSEDLQKREVCRTISAQVDADDVRRKVAKIISRFEDVEVNQDEITEKLIPNDTSRAKVLGTGVDRGRFHRSYRVLLSCKSEGYIALWVVCYLPDNTPYHIIDDRKKCIAIGQLLMLSIDIINLSSSDGPRRKTLHLRDVN